MMMLLLNGTSIRETRLIQEAPPACQTNSDLVLLILTIPLWTFFTIYLMLILIHYLRKLQYFNLYDKCTTKNAHFRYDFHLIVGKYSTNYNKIESHLIVDLLDNQLISTITVQVPGSTIFNENQAFMYRHSRADLRCVSFTIYRRHPIKDVKCVRVAHGCANPDSRLFVFGLNLVDVTNAENKFFPITSLVKYRGTQWALTSSFEPNNEQNFTQMGCGCHDPFSTSRWPSHIETLIMIFYIWCTVLCFGSLISVDAILKSVTLHAVTVSFIVGSSAIVIGFIYLRFIKTHVIDQHYDTLLRSLLSYLFLGLVIGLSLIFWALSLSQEQACSQTSIAWAKSSLASASILSLILLLAAYYTYRRRISIDSAKLDELENNLTKTNSRPGIEFVKEPGVNCFFRNQAATTTQLPPLNAKKVSTSSKTTKQTATDGHNKLTSNGKKGSLNKGKQSAEKHKKNDETLDNAFANSDNMYIKTKNRNSISQYV